MSLDDLRRELEEERKKARDEDEERKIRAELADLRDRKKIITVKKIKGTAVHMFKNAQAMAKSTQKTVKKATKKKKKRRQNNDFGFNFNAFR